MLGGIVAHLPLDRAGVAAAAAGLAPDLEDLFGEALMTTRLPTPPPGERSRGPWSLSSRRPLDGARDRATDRAPLRED